MLAREGGRVKFILRRIIRGLPAAIFVIALIGVISAVWLQNHTTVRREGDFFVLTPDDVSERFPSRTPETEIEATESSDDVGDQSSVVAKPAVNASVPIARKYVLSRRAGFQMFGRGHSIIHEAELFEFNDPAPFLRRLSDRLKRDCQQAGREFTEVDWSTVWDGFRDPSFSMLNWEGETKIDLLFVSTEAVSFAEYRHEYTGGAHGNHWLAGRNFIAEGDSVRELSLSDLFDEKTDWLMPLLKACMADLHRQGASRVGEGCLDDPIESGFSIEDLQSFTLSADGMRFYFSPYHMGCYAEGLYSVHVPYAVVTEFVPTNSPLRRFMTESTPSRKVKS